MKQDPARGINWFKWITVGVFSVFFGILVTAAVVAKSRSFTGVTGVDASQIQKMRLEANAKYREVRAERDPYRDAEELR